MAIRLIATDLDGTLLQDDHCTVAEEEINALAEAAERGAVHVIASGRTWDTLQDTARQVKEVRYAILSNGAAWYRPADGTYELIGGIPYPVWEPCSRFLRENGAVFEVYCRGKSYLEKSDLPRFVSPHLSEKFREELTRHITLVEGVESILEGKEIEKISVLTIPMPNCARVEEKLVLSGDFEITTSIPGNMEINRKGVDKGTGLARLCAELGISAEEVMAFGDSNNDLAMLRWAHYSFAMGNGVQEAKDAARFLTKSNAEHGVAEAIRRYVRK